MIVLAAFFLRFHDSIDARLMGDGEIFFGAIAVVVLTSGWWFEPKQKPVWLWWGVLAPLVASPIGYAAVTVVYYVKHGHFGAPMPLSSWLVVGLVFPYIICNVWTLSLALPIVNAINHYLASPKPLSPWNMPT